MLEALRQTAGATPLPATFFEFTPGIFLALLRLEVERRPSLRLPSSTALIAAAATCWVVAACWFDAAPLIAAQASFLLLAAVILPVRDGRIARLLEIRFLAVIGIASYSLYLWHGPIISSLERHMHLRPAALLALGLALCVPIALLSYAVIERPFLRLRGRWGSTAAGHAAPASPAPIASGIPSQQEG